MAQKAKIPISRNGPRGNVEEQSDASLPALSDNARAVLARRYLRKDEQGHPVESPADMFRRVARHVAQAEKQYGGDEAAAAMEERFFNLMTDLKFLPNSPTLMNAGRRLGQLAACFVLPVEDRMEGIFDALKQAAIIHKSGGGTGFSFSRLRPKNSKVGTTGGVASGPVSFMKIFNTATEQVKQGGTRRGANMAVLRVDHPDIMEFIHCKQDNDTLNNFNISVAVTDTFMKAVREDGEYNLVDPRDGRTTGRLRAAEVYDALILQAWKNGDPGVFFIDRVNRDNPTPSLGEIESSNPCVTADTWTMTDQGPRQISALNGKVHFLAIDGKLYPSGESGFFKTGEKPVFRLRTREGFELRLTADHPVRRAVAVSARSIRSEWVPATGLSPGDKILLHDHRSLKGWPGPYGLAEGYLTGLLLGDGTLKSDKAVLSFWPDPLPPDTVPGQNGGVMAAAAAFARCLPHRSDFGGWMPVAGRNEYRLSLGALKAIAENLGMSPGYKRITPALEQCSSDFYRGFLGGLFDADGSVQGTPQKGVSIRLAQSDLPTLQSVQRMLLRLGMVARIYPNRRHAGVALLPDGRGGKGIYPIRAQHELVLSGENLARFHEIIGFRHEGKNTRLAEALAGYRRALNRERFVATVAELVPESRETVFDVQVPGVHRFDANGIMAHNCGEQPLLPMEACNLGSINLDRFVADTDQGPVIDYDALGEAVRLAVRFLDDTIDVSRYPLPEIDRMVKGNRKIGLGVMGFADLLFRLSIPYNSPEGLACAESLMAFIQETSHQASRELAEARGVFKNHALSVFKDRPEARYRNATTTTIAPTGTLSIIANCSSGIEPLFALSFVRRVMDGDQLLEVNPHFEAVARRRGFYSPELMDRIAHTGSIAAMEEIPEDVRRVFVTAHDISPKWHVRMQAAFQSHTDNAVSKTVNLPKESTVEDVRRIFDLAFELGCKGVTIYRDGSKANQVLSVAPAAETGSGFSAIVRQRPETLDGFTTKIRTGLGQLYVTVTEYDGRPFEVFATIGKSGRSTTAKTEAIGRLVSLALRSGVTVDKVVDQLKGIGGEHPVFQEGGLVLSIPDAIARVLERRYLDDRRVRRGNGSPALIGAVCPECGQTISFEEGCMTCHFCGYSKCG